MILSSKLNREIFRLALPAIATNITIPLLGLSDTVIAGHLEGSEPLAAIAVGSMMMNVVFWLFGFLRMGTTGLTAQYFGLKRFTDCQIVFSRSFVLAITIGILIICFSNPLSYLLLKYISPEQEIISSVTSYFMICILAAPAILATTSIQGWFLGMQTTFYPMVIYITINITNILLSILFVFGLKLGFIGLAYGTMSANWIGLILSIILAKRFVGEKKMWCKAKEIFKGDALSKFFHVNSDIFFRSACIMIVSLTVTSYGARQGIIILGANAVMLQFFHFFSYFMDGFAFAAEAETGKYAGANNIVQLKTSFKAIFSWSAIVALVFFFVYLFLWKDIISLITDNMEIKNAISDYKVWLWLIPPLTVAAFIFDGAFIGLTATRRMLVTTLSATILFYTISLIHLSSTNGTFFTFSYPDNNTLWAAFMCYLVVRGVMLGLQYNHVSSEKYIRKNIL